MDLVCDSALMLTKKKNLRRGYQCAVVGRPFWNEAGWQIWSFVPCLVSVFHTVRLDGKGESRAAEV